MDIYTVEVSECCQSAPPTLVLTTRFRDKAITRAKEEVSKNKYQGVYVERWNDDIEIKEDYVWEFDVGDIYEGGNLIKENQNAQENNNSI